MTTLESFQLGVAFQFRPSRVFATLAGLSVGI
jgi:hypothetical protein